MKTFNKAVLSCYPYLHNISSAVNRKHPGVINLQVTPLLGRSVDLLGNVLADVDGGVGLPLEVDIVEVRDLLEVLGLQSQDPLRHFLSLPVNL